MALLVGVSVVLATSSVHAERLVSLTDAILLAKPIRSPAPSSSSPRRRAELQAAVRARALNAGAAYWRAKRAELLVKLAERGQQRYSELLQVTNARVLRGVAPETDFTASNGRLLESSALLARRRRALQSARDALARVLDLEGEVLVLSDDPFDRPLRPQTGTEHHPARGVDPLPAEVRNALTTIDYASEEENLLEEAAAAAWTTRAVMRRRYESGAAMLLELLQAEDDLLRLETRIMENGIVVVLARLVLEMSANSADESHGADRQFDASNCHHQGIDSGR
jgi:hypothetical protein